MTLTRRSLLKVSGASLAGTLMARLPGLSAGAGPEQTVAAAEAVALDDAPGGLTSPASLGLLGPAGESVTRFYELPPTLKRWPFGIISMTLERPVEWAHAWNAPPALIPAALPTLTMHVRGEPVAEVLAAFDGEPWSMMPLVTRDAIEFELRGMPAEAGLARLVEQLEEGMASCAS